MGTTLHAIVEVRTDDNPSWDDVAEFEFNKDYELSLWIDGQAWVTKGWDKGRNVPSSKLRMSLRAREIYDGDLGEWYQQTTLLGGLWLECQKDSHRELYVPPSTDEKRAHGRWRALLACLATLESCGYKTRLLIYRI